MRIFTRNQNHHTTMTTIESIHKATDLLDQLGPVAFIHDPNCIKAGSFEKSLAFENQEHEVSIEVYIDGRIDYWIDPSKEPVAAEVWFDHVQQLINAQD